MSVSSGWSTLAQVVYKRTYARSDDEPENWERTVERVIAGNVRNIKVADEEITRLRYFLLNRKASPAGRGLWFSGTKAHERLGGVALANCWYVSADDWTNYILAQDLLMLGGGVGISVEHRFTSKLPRVRRGVVIQHRPTKDADFIVPDSREGWNELTRKVLEAFFETGRGFSYSTVCIRGVGEKILGFGGVSAGPRPLIALVEKLCSTLVAREGRAVRPTDAADILCAIGEMVVSGNVRRCLPGEALVHTREGLKPIKEVEVGTEVLTSQGYRKVVNTFEQGRQETVRIKTQEGYFECTPNHRMAKLVGVDTYEWVEAKNLQPDDRLCTTRTPIEGRKTLMPSWSYEKPKHSTTCVDITIPNLDADMAWFLGLFYGDGYTFANRKDNGFNAYVSLVFQINELDIAEKAKAQLERFGVYVKLERRKDENSYLVHSQSKQLAWYLDENFKQPHTSLTIHKCILEGKLPIRVAFLAGLLDSDGAANNRPVHLVSTVYEHFAAEVQTLAYSCGFETRLSKGSDDWPSRVGWQRVYVVALITNRSKRILSECPQLTKKIRFNKNGQRETGFPSKWFTKDRAKLHATSTSDVCTSHYEHVYGDSSFSLCPAKVESIEGGRTTETYDIEIEDVHEFFCNGYLTHNSALLVLGDPWDKEYLKAKRWDLELIPSQRSCANWSVVCDDVEDLHPLFWKTYEHGEPFGIVNRTNIQKYGRMGEHKKDTAVGVNPCVPAGTEILTSTGYRRIEECVGETVNVWNGFEFSPVQPQITGHEQRLLRVSLSSGQGLVCTPAHKFWVKDTYRSPERFVAAQDLELGMKLAKTHMPVVERGEVIEEAKAYSQGFYSGDGTDGYEQAWLYGPKLKCAARMSGRLAAYQESQDRASFWYDFTVSAKNFVPHRWSLPARIAWLAGLLDSDGTELKEGGSQIGSVDRQFLLDVQKLLTTMGVTSKVTLMSKAEMRPMPDGKGGSKLYACQDCFRLLIGAVQIQSLKKLGLHCERLPFDAIPQRDAGQFVVVTEVEEIGLADAVYCFKEGKRGLGCFEGVVTGQCAEACLEDGEACNLQEIALPNLVDVDEFVEAARLMHRWGKRVSCDPFHQAKAEAVVKKNRRIGTGITGCLQSPLFALEPLDRAYAAIQEENVSYSNELDIPPSIRTTVVKPSGTLSKVFDMRGYEGIHAAYSRFYVQRVRFAANDPLIPLLLDANHPMEPVIKLDGTLDHNTLVVDFYEKAPTGAPIADENWTTWKQLEAHALAQAHWSDQAVSVTVYYKKSEIPAVKAWLTENISKLKTISFLCHNDHGFKQAPKEAVTEAVYERAISKVRQVDLSSVSNGLSIDGTECDGGACPVR